jgi:hypothetical protein
MSAYDDIVSYNRKFREAAEKAFPLPRNPDVDRIILHCYEKNLYSKQLVQKLVVENNPQDVDAAMVFTEAQSAGQSRLQSLGLLPGQNEHEPMDISAAGNHPACVTGISHQSPQAIEQRMSAMQDKIDFLEAHQNAYPGQAGISTGQAKKQKTFNQTQGKGRGTYRAQGPNRGMDKSRQFSKNQWSNDGRPICNFCGKTGHKWLECYQRNGQQKRNNQGNFNPQQNQGNFNPQGHQNQGNFNPQGQQNPQNQQSNQGNGQASQGWH